FFSSRRRHTRSKRDWSSDVCSSDLLYGLKLNIYDVIGKGSGLLLIDIGVILFSIGLMLLLNKYIKGGKHLTLLLGIGTGVCGAAAIAAVSPILKSREKDSAISIGRSEEHTSELQS